MIRRPRHGEGPPVPPLVPDPARPVENVYVEFEKEFHYFSAKKNKKRNLEIVIPTGGNSPWLSTWRPPVRLWGLGGRQGGVHSVHRLRVLRSASALWDAVAEIV